MSCVEGTESIFNRECSTEEKLGIEISYEVKEKEATVPLKGGNHGVGREKSQPFNHN